MTSPSPSDGSDNHWITIDLVAELLEVSIRRAREIAKAEGWRTARDQGSRTTQYHFADIRRTYNHRKA